MAAAGLHHTRDENRRGEPPRAARHETSTKTGIHRLKSFIKELFYTVLQARETGICPVRRELYTQCFDEIIRQVTINCAERGLLLLRVRDEMRMTIEAYQALYCSSVAFGNESAEQRACLIHLFLLGMRKALQAEQGKSDLYQEVEILKSQKLELEQQITDLKQKAEQADRRAAETRLAEERKHTEEITFLKKTNQQLKVKANVSVRQGLW